MADLSQITIGIKSFLRPDKLTNALAGIREHLSECEVIVADDSIDTGADTYHIGYSQPDNTLVIYCPFDSGFGYKSNLIAANVKTPYLLVGSDDFDFDSPLVRTSVIKLANVLDHNPNVHIASGRVNARPYEFNLIDDGETITEMPVGITEADIARGFVYCDLTVNFSLMSRYIYPLIHWDDDVKIGGGEHGAFFVDCKRKGLRTVYVPGVNIYEQPGQDSPRYKYYRNRARSPERPCFVERGIKKYVLGNGTVDYGL